MKGKVHKCRNLCYDFKKDYEIVLKVFHCVVLYSGNRILKSSLTSVYKIKLLLHITYRLANKYRQYAASHA